ncbi:hypothetical protein GPJ56_002303 [Histomonas meleagridis]|uniref:uncharacterized protein n=1 Tax=Histomonas meleagridis TaxID=135588 RepID=UPI00355AAB7C|nr:hypothetical protein GPJ56_002303 [Histomonas meleagridis]KAH0804564.1 hypothetical protein GO595_003394 [Histomonas meleagridis]
MEAFTHHKNLGVTKMKQNKYQRAIEDFNKVINGLSPTNDEEALLKSVCLLNRSACYTQLQKYTEGLEDATNVIHLYNQVRPEEKQKAMTPEEVAKDPLTPMLCLAYVRRGECFESQLEFLDAFHEYGKANMLIPNGEGQKALQSLLKKVNIPAIDQSDKDLQLFSLILLHFLNESDLITSLNNLIEYLKVSEISEDILKKINDTNCSNILYGIIQLYGDNQLLVDQSLICLQFLASKGIATVCNGYPIIRHVMTQWENDLNIIGDCLKLLRIAPFNLYKILSKENFIPLITESLKKKITDDEVEAAFFLLFQIANSPSLLVELAAEEIVDLIMEKKTKFSLLLLSKLSILPESLKRAEELKASEWIFTILSKDSIEDDEIIASSLILSRILIRNVFLEEEKEEQTKKSRQAFDLLVKNVMKNTKNHEIIANAFATFSIAIDYAPEKVKELKMIRLASVLLSIHMGSETATQNLVAFLYESSINGMIDDIKENKAVLPTVMKALSKYPRNEPIVERAVALGYLLNHKNKMDLIKAALTQFPNSSFLKEFVTKNEVFSNK